MSALRGVCLLCQIKAVIRPQQPVTPKPWQPLRSSSTAQLRRRKPARMTLSPNVAVSSGRYGEERKPSTRLKNSPFGGMNQTRPPRDNPRGRLLAQIKPSLVPDKKAPEKKDSPLYKALKMQTALSPVPYGYRTAVKAKIAGVTNFEQFSLLPVVRDSVYANALPGLAEVTCTPIQRQAIPALLKHTTPKPNPRQVGMSPSDNDPPTPKFDQFLLA